MASYKFGKLSESVSTVYSRGIENCSLHISTTNSKLVPERVKPGHKIHKALIIDVDTWEPGSGSHSLHQLQEEEGIIYV